MCKNVKGIVDENGKITTAITFKILHDENLLYNYGVVRLEECLS
jgi:hypothetical protein